MVRFSSDGVASKDLSSCLNCGADLQGPFCSRCGQRAIAPYPTLRELAGDAWHELSGYDGRFARTIRMLCRPGVLTLEVLKGRRASYLSPVRLYLIASLIYFVLAAAAPNMRAPRAAVVPGSRVNIDLIDGGGLKGLSAEQRDEVLRNVERAPWGMAPLLRSALIDPDGLRLRFAEVLPRVLFILVPVFAGIVSLFYWGRGLPQHLVFALHLHAALFIALALRSLVHFARSRIIGGAADVVLILFVATYGLIAFRRVYGETWPRVLLKSAGILILYAGAGITALLSTFAWAALT